MGHVKRAAADAGEKSSSRKSLLNSWFPHAQNPIIVSAPMFGVSNGALAAQVSEAGGIGIVPGGWLFAPGSPHLAKVASDLASAREILGLQDQKQVPLPVGLSFLLFHETVSLFETTAIPLLREHRPVAVWLFAHDTNDSAVIPRIITALHKSGILAICQVGNVAAARQAVLDGADVVVAQGGDAGGHQYANTSGLVSLVPEVRDMLDAEFPGRQVALLAAGGIADGRGVAAALTLGAEGAVMGTRFVIAAESTAPDFQKTAIKSAVDGGIATSKSTFHDDLQNMKVWPKAYDGRAINGQSYEDHVAGVGLAENIQKLTEAQTAGDFSRNLTWAGTAVGLVNDVLPAGVIVTQSREAAKQEIQRLQSWLRY